MSKTPTEVAIEVCNKCTAPSTRDKSLNSIVSDLSADELYETLVLADAEGHERLIMLVQRELRERGRDDLIPRTVRSSADRGNEYKDSS